MLPKGLLFLILLWGVILLPTSGVKGTPKAITEATARATAETTEFTPGSTGLMTQETMSGTSTTSWATSSTSYRIVRVNYDVKLSTATGDLTRAMCADNATFRSIEGVFQTYKFIAINLGNNDEGEIATFTCGTDKNVVKECQEFVNSRLEGIRLAINGTIQQESSVPSIFYRDRYKKEFNLTLEYESHLKANITCVYELSDQANLTTSIFTIKTVDELYEFLITPNDTKITIGESYTLTCYVDSERALKHLIWTRAINSGTETWFDCNRENHCTKTRHYDPPSEVLIISTTSMKEKSEYTYKCTERHTPNSKQGFAKAYVSVHPVDKTVVITVKSKNSWIIALIVTGVVLVVAAVVFIIVLAIQKRRTRATPAVSILMTEARQTSNEYEGDRRENESLMQAIETVNDIMARISRKHSAWELDKKSLTIKQQIGVGNFGYVFSGTMPDEFGIIQTVAIKTIKEEGLEVAALLDYEKEMEVMTSLRHRNIVNLLGICTVSLPFYIVMEYMENGPLSTYLVDFAPSRDTPLGGLTVAQLAWICQQPCDALEYLTSRSVVHRDVSVRNCLVGLNLQVKLADFGLSRDTSDNAKNYYKKEGGMMPVKWMAPEALTYGRYTSANDVWAFGVLAWEVFSFGALPYQHLTNQQVIVNICKGERMERPHLCPQGLWDNILQCWAEAPDERIMLTALLAFFKDYSQECTEAAQRA